MRRRLHRICGFDDVAARCAPGSYGRLSVGGAECWCARRFSHGQRAKAAKRRRQNSWVLDGIRALNWLGGQGRSVTEEAQLTMAQHVAVQRLACIYAAVPRATDAAAPQEAFKALWGGETWLHRFRYREQCSLPAWAPCVAQQRGGSGAIKQSRAASLADDAGDRPRPRD